MASKPLAATPDEAVEIDEALGELLIARGRLDAAGLGRALRVREANHERLHLLLPKLGLVSERDVAAALAQLLDLPLATEADYPDLPLHGDRVSANFLKEARILPLADTPRAWRWRWPTRSTATPSPPCSCSPASRCCPGSACRPTSRPRSSACSAAAARSARSSRRSAIRARSAPRTTSSACAIWRARRRSCGSSTG